MSGFQKGIKAFAIFLAIMIILSIFSGITFGFSIISTIFEGNEVGQKNFYQTFDDVMSIDMENSFSEISVVPGETFAVEAYGVSSKFEAKVIQNSLKIVENQSGFWRKKSGKIVITIPKNVYLNEFFLESGAGKVTIQGLNAQKFELNQGAGQVIIEDSIFQNTSLRGGAGRIEVKNSKFNDLSLESGVGSVEIEAEIKGSSKIECGVGSTNLKLLGKKDEYKIHVEKGLGSIKIENVIYEDDSWIGNGQNTLEIEGGIGSIRVDFK